MSDQGDPILTKTIWIQNQIKKESKKGQSASLRSEIPEWLQEFREILVDDEIPLQGGSHASSSHEASLEPTTKRREDLCRQSVETHFPKDRNCEICQRTKITRDPCRRRNGGAVRRAENFGHLITADHKVFSDNCESRNNHRYASLGTGSSHSMDSGVSVQNKNFTRNPVKLAKVPGTREETKSHIHWQFLRIRQILWRSLLESLHVYTTQISTKWDWWKSNSQIQRRNLCCIVAIRSQWKLVCRFYGMLHLSAKRHWTIIWWQDALWETFSATIQRTHYSIWLSITL